MKSSTSFSVMVLAGLACGLNFTALTTWTPSLPPPQSVHVACATVDVPLSDAHVLELAPTSALNAQVFFVWESSELIRSG